MEIVEKKPVSKLQSGQIFLITLLIMVVGLTVALAVIARSVTSVKVSTQEEESQRAFYAAEAGLEETLLSNTEGASSIGNANYIVKITPNSADLISGVFVFPELLGQDEAQPVWLVNHDANGGIVPPGPSDGRYPLNKLIYICWQGPGSGPIPAMEVTILHQRTQGTFTYGIARGAYDPDGGRSSNNLTLVTDTGGGYCGGGFQYRRTLDFDDPGGFNITGQRRLVALRLRPIYNSAKVAIQVESGTTFPSQGKKIESLGTAGSAQRKLTINRAYSTFPPIFDYVLFSGQPLAK